MGDDPSVDDLHSALTQQFTDPGFIAQSPDLPADSPDGPVKRNFSGDESINHFVQDVGDTYQDTMAKAGADLDQTKQRRKDLEDQVRNLASAHALSVWGKTAPRPGIVAENFPFARQAVSRVQEEERGEAQDAFEKGNANAYHYAQLGSQIQEQQDIAQRGTLENIGRTALGFGGMAAEYAALPGASGITGGAGLAGKALAAAKAGAIYTAGQAPLTLSLDLAQGKSPSDIGREQLSSLIDNTAFGGVAQMGMLKSVSPGLVARAKDVALGSLKVLGAGEVAEDVKRTLGLSPQAGPMARLLNPSSDSADRAKAMNDFIVQGGAALLFEGAMQTMKRGQRVDPEQIANQVAKTSLESQPETVHQPPMGPEPGVDRLSAEAAMAPKEEAPAKEEAPTETYHGMQVERVDPEEYRKQGLSEENLGTAAVHGNKIIVSDEVEPGRDMDKVMQQALEEHRAQARGLSPDAAEQEMIAHEHREPKAQDVSPETYAKVYADEGRTLSSGHVLRLVDGEAVRRLIDPTFVEGGNHQALRYVPEGEIWVEKDVADKHPAEVEPIVKHEVTEESHMKAGMSYKDAHAKASIEELALRRQEPSVQPSVIGSLQKRWRSGGKVDISELPISDKQKTVLSELMLGKTLEQIGKDNNLGTKQSVWGILQRAQKRLEPLTPRLAEQIRHRAVEEMPENYTRDELIGMGWTPRQVSESPGLQAEVRRAKKPLSTVERIQKEMSDVAQKYADLADKNEGGKLTDEQQQQFRADGERLRIALARARGERVPVEPASVRPSAAGELPRPPGIPENANAGQAPEGRQGAAGAPGGGETAGNELVQAMRTPGGQPPRQAGPPSQAAPPQAPAPPPADAKALAANVLRQMGSERAQRSGITTKAMRQGESSVDKLLGWHTGVEAKFARTIEALPDGPEKVQRFLDAMDPYQHGLIQNMTGDERKWADATKKLQDQRTAEIAKYDLANTYIQNYFSQLWQNRDGSDVTPEQAAKIWSMARRPLMGRMGFAKQRTYDTYKDGLDSGLVPKSWNPATLTIMAMDQQDKAITGHEAVNAWEKMGIWKYFPLGTHEPGWTAINDKVARVFAPPIKDMREYFDQKMSDDLRDFAERLGIRVTDTEKGVPGGYQKAANPLDPDTILRRFGAPDDVVLSHEIGHALDDRFDLQRRFNSPQIARELEDLANLRASGHQSPEFQAYIQQPDERIANLAAGYIHAPELTRQVAPTAYAAFDKFIKSNPRLKDFSEIKPSLELGQRDQAIKLAGPQLVGNYMMPTEAAKLVDQHFAPGLGGNAAYRVFRGFSGQMLQAALGWSGFHAMGTTLNAEFSALALATKALRYGDMDTVKDQLAKAFVPLAAGVSQAKAGAALRQEWYAPGSGTPEVQAMVSALKAGGARARGGAEHLGNMYESFQKSVNLALGSMEADQKGAAAWEGAKALAKALPALNQFVSRPLMEHYVPAVKMGAAADLLRFEIKRQQPQSEADMRRIAGEVWDNIDNRFGLLTHDNLFWNRTAKDALTATFQSLGWNLGTVRELGGGILDLKKTMTTGELTNRTAFLLALSAGTAMYGAMYQFLMTGKRPEEPLDLWFPKTGVTRKDGSADRISFPTYAKDLYGTFRGVSSGPGRIAFNLFNMVQNKLNPALSTGAQMLRNEDYFGNPIHPKSAGGDPLFNKDMVLHALSAFVPYSVRGAMQQSRQGAGLGTQAQAMAGITPAPSYITRTEEEADKAKARSALGKALQQARDTGAMADMQKKAAQTRRMKSLLNPPITRSRR